MKLHYLHTNTPQQLVDAFEAWQEANPSQEIWKAEFLSTVDLFLFAREGGSSPDELEELRKENFRLKMDLGKAKKSGNGQ